jgi:hypothetical protein
MSCLVRLLLVRSASPILPVDRTLQLQQLQPWLLHKPQDSFLVETPAQAHLLLMEAKAHHLPQQ